MNSAHSNPDALVIGGGPAGSMVALRLAAAGREVVLVEKEQAAHHKVCGEFLSREAVHYLEQAGIAPRHLGAAVIRKLRLASGDKVAETSLPFEALSLSRHALDEALLARAAEHGCNVLRGVAVESLAAEGKGWLATLRNGQPLRASALFLATGKHDLRGWTRSVGKQNDLIGFKMHWRLPAAQAQALRESMDLFLFGGGYGGLSLIEDDAANLCLVVRRATLRNQGGWPQLLEAILAGNVHLRQLLQDAKPEWKRPLAISPIPYGYLAEPTSRAWCVGDQAAVIPSFTGDGISIALHSAALAAQMYLGAASPAEYHRTLNKQLRHAMTFATWLSRAAVAPLGRASAIFAVSLFPPGMRPVAALTRIPDHALLRHEPSSTGIGLPGPRSAGKLPA